MQFIYWVSQIFKSMFQKVYLFLLLLILHFKKKLNVWTELPGIYHVLIYFIIYPSMLSVLILLISQSVIWCSRLPHCGFLTPQHPLWNWWHNTQFFSQCTMHEVLWCHSYRTVQNFICLQILLLNINASLWCIKNDFQFKTLTRV